MAAKLARRFSSKLILLPVINQRLLKQLSGHLQVPVDSLLPECRERAQQQLGEFLKRLRRGALEEVFFGSTAQKVVRLLPCPVLRVPLPRG